MEVQRNGLSKLDWRFESWQLSWGHRILRGMNRPDARHDTHLSTKHGSTIPATGEAYNAGWHQFTLNDCVSVCMACSDEQYKQLTCARSFNSPSGQLAVRASASLSAAADCITTRLHEWGTYRQQSPLPPPSVWAYRPNTRFYGQLDYPHVLHSVDERPIS